jgi:hypothetical protein
VYTDDRLALIFGIVSMVYAIKQYNVAVMALPIPNPKT